MATWLTVGILIFLVFYLMLMTVWYRSEYKQLKKQMDTLTSILSEMQSQRGKEVETIYEIGGKLQMLDGIGRQVVDSAKAISALQHQISGISPKVDTIYDSILGAKGRSGEMLLVSLLERLLLPGEYSVQVDVGGYRVDVMLHINMAEKKIRIPIDSKFTGGNPADVKKRIDEVAKYVPYSDTGFALMYVPSDSLYLHITGRDELLGYALSKDVYIVGPTSLFALIRSFYMLRALADVSEKHKEVLKQMRTLHRDIDDILVEGDKVMRHSRNLTSRLDALMGKLKKIKEV